MSKTRLQWADSLVANVPGLAPTSQWSDETACVCQQAAHRFNWEIGLLAATGALISMGNSDGQLRRIISFACRSTGPVDALSAGHA